jgi:hypothetical protein
MILYEREHIIHGEKMIIRIAKDNMPYYSSERDYYRYHCSLLKVINTNFLAKLFKQKKVIYSYSTYWLNYYRYRGNVDVVIDELLSNYDEKIREEKYIHNNELKYNHE